MPRNFAWKSLDMVKPACRLDQDWCQDLSYGEPSLPRVGLEAGRGKPQQIWQIAWRIANMPKILGFCWRTIVNVWFLSREVWKFRFIQESALLKSKTEKFLWRQVVVEDYMHFLTHWGSPTNLKNFLDRSSLPQGVILLSPFLDATSGLAPRHFYVS